MIRFFQFSVPECLDDPPSIPNAAPTLWLPARVVVYGCVDGYEPAGDIQNAVVACSTLDADNIPWTWNEYNTEFRCIPSKKFDHIFTCRHMYMYMYRVLCAHTALQAGREIND